jgi:metallo-beta-lactamase class B
MSVHRLAIFLALSSLPVGTVFAVDPAPANAVPGRAWIQKLFDGLKAPVPPRHLVGNIYYVGASGVSSFLITTPAGHILLDTGFEDTVPIITHGVEQLGFKVADIKLILGSHAHIDHAGGHALMKKLTGARVVASAADARLLESGGADDFLPWPKDTLAYAPVRVDETVTDGGTVSLGGVTLTAHLTPGHTRGATTWTMDVTEAGRVYHVVFFSSTTVNPGVSLRHNPAYPEIVADYETTFARLKALPCDIFFSPHGGQFGMQDKFARQDAGEGVRVFVDPAGWSQLLATMEGAFRNQLAAEQAAAK